MIIRITQTGTREFTDVFEFDMSTEEYAELKRSLKDDDRTISEVQEHDLYDLGFELDNDTLVHSEQGDITHDDIEIEVIRTKKKITETA